MSVAAEQPRAFRTLTVAVLIAVGVFAFAAFFVLSAYAPSLRNGDGDGRANGLSVSAVGYAALAELAEAAGTEVILSRAPPFTDGPDTLTLITPDGLGETGIEVPTPAHRTLLILPKWRTRADPDRPGWITLGPPRGATALEFDVDGHLIDLTVERRGDREARSLRRPEAEEADDEVAEAPEEAPGVEDAAEEDEGTGGSPIDPETIIEFFGESVIARRTEPQDIALNPGAFDFGPLPGPLPAPPEIERVASLQTVSGEHVEPVWTDEYGRIVLGRVTVHPWSEDGYDYEDYVPSETYVLADPDLLNTMGLSRFANAQAAAALIGELGGGRPVRFDLTEFGYARAKNLLTVALEPPFLAASLAGLSAALILALHATARFGPPQREAVGFALGKAALADNTATLLSASDKVGTLGPRYAGLVRRRIAAALGLAPNDARLDERAARALGTDALPEATADANAAQGAGPVLRAARRLHTIKEQL